MGAVAQALYSFQRRAIIAQVCVPSRQHGRAVAHALYSFQRPVERVEVRVTLTAPENDLHMSVDTMSCVCTATLSGLLLIRLEGPSV